MKIAIQVFNMLLILAGFVFFLQGINVLSGSYMTGDPQWAINGAAVTTVAIGSFFWARRGK